MNIKLNFLIKPDKLKHSDQSLEASAKCTVCQGSGRKPTTKSVFNRDISGDYNICTNCNGTGQITIIRERV